MARTVYELLDGGELYEADWEYKVCRDCKQDLSDEEKNVGVCDPCVYTELETAEQNLDDLEADEWANVMLAPWKEEGDDAY